MVLYDKHMCVCVFTHFQRLHVKQAVFVFLFIRKEWRRFECMNVIIAVIFDHSN